MSEEERDPSLKVRLAIIDHEGNEVISKSVKAIDAAEITAGDLWQDPDRFLREGETLWCIDAGILPEPHPLQGISPEDATEWAWRFSQFHDGEGFAYLRWAKHYGLSLEDSLFNKFQDAYCGTFHSFESYTFDYIKRNKILHDIPEDLVRYENRSRSRRISGATHTTTSGDKTSFSGIKTLYLPTTDNDSSNAAPNKEERIRNTKNSHL